ncbi:MAG: MarR family transcriptional regulator [Myxococcota bacterium]|nr:MarR family transcriptional regulator [Myxococcota bacterium]
MAGRLLGLLLICNPAEQSSGQLSAQLGASKGSISTNTRLLIRISLVEKVAVPGSRSTHFRVRSGAWEMLMEEQMSLLSNFRSLLDDGLEMMSAASPQQRRRLEETRDFYAFYEQEFPLILRHWRARQRSD